MDILDTPEVQHESDVPFLPTAIKWGLISAAISVIYYLVAQLMGFAVPTSMGEIALQFVVGIVITVAIAYFAIKSHRDELGGFISFKRAFLVSFVALIISILISNGFSYIYVNFIDPDSLEAALEGTEKMLSNMGLDEDQIEQAMIDTRASMKPTTMVRNGVIGGLFFAAIFGAIMGAIMKAERPMSI